MQKLLNNMISNRSFQVVFGSSISNKKTLNNGLPQGSVLAPLLFSLYIYDMPPTVSRKFGYADDWALAIRKSDITETESILTSDLQILGDYFTKWRLKPNPSKTEVSCFHLLNAQANTQLKVTFQNQILKHNFHPKYLGITLDRSLNFKQHLMQTASKLKSRNNIIQKLCGTTWGSSTSVLRTSALGLVYSAAEYCAPVWLNSAHTDLVDVQLNNTMRILTGTIRPTPVHWLPVLSHIPPPEIKRKAHLAREYIKLMENKDLPLHNDLVDINLKRLKSRHPPLVTANFLYENNFDVNRAWREKWAESADNTMMRLRCIEEEPPGFNLPRKIWVTLNRIRTGFGKCADMMSKWGSHPSSECSSCGASKQTVAHIVYECPTTLYPGNAEDFMLAREEAVEYINNAKFNL